MRPLEILLATLLAARFLLSLLPLPRRGVNALGFAAAVAAVAQVAVEQYRWQMVPLYVLAAVALLLALAGLRRDSVLPRRRALTAAGAGAALLLVALGTALPVLVPVPGVPQPTGPYRVGTFSVMLVDPARKELYSGNPGDPRAIMVQVWYPADPQAGAQPSAWVQSPEIVGPAIARWLRLPPFFLDHLRLARTHAYERAPVAAAEAQYPVLLFSHGWGGFRAQNTYQVEELASHGYVVLGMDHAYGAVVTVFPDGRVAYNNPAALPMGAPNAEFAAGARTLVDQWAGDLGFALDTLAQWNAQDPAGLLAGRLDLGRVGVFGHSTGGGATLEFCGRDARCKAGLTMDPFMLPVSERVLAAGETVPFAHLFSERWSSQANYRLWNELYAASTGPAYQLTIAGTAHYDFTDMPAFSPLAPYIGLKGPLEGSRVLRIIDDYSVAFFDRYLKGKGGDLLNASSAAYPEVTFAAKP